MQQTQNENKELTRPPAVILMRRKLKTMSSTHKDKPNPKKEYCHNNQVLPNYMEICKIIITTGRNPS